MENISNSVILDVIRHINSCDATNMKTSFSIENGCIVMQQDGWIIKFEGDGIIRLDNPEYGFGTQTYDDHAFYARENADFIEICKKRYINEYRNGKIWEKVKAVITDEIKAYEKMYADGKISVAYKNKMVSEIESIRHRKELFDAMKND